MVTNESLARGKEKLLIDDFFTYISIGKVGRCNGKAKGTVYKSGALRPPFAAASLISAMSCFLF